MSQAELMVVGEQFFAALLHDSIQLNVLFQLIFVRRGNRYAHHVNAADGIASLPSRETCSLAHVGVEGSRPAGPSRRFHLSIWLADRNGRTCPSNASGPPGPPFLINVFS